MDVEITLLSHVFVGGGEDAVLSPYMDFVASGNCIRLVDRDKLLKVLSRQQIDRYVSFIRQNWDNNRPTKVLADFLRDNRIDLEGVLSGVKIEVKGDIKGREVKLFISSAGRNYIPGSTIKGSVRTALFYSYMKKGFDKNRVMGNVSQVERGRFNPKSAFPTLVGRNVGLNFKPHDDPLKLLQVTDTTFFGYEDMLVVNTRAVSMNKERSGTPIVLEVARAGSKVRTRIKVAGGFARDVYGDEFWGFLQEGDYSKLFGYVNEFSLDFVRHELVRLRRFRGNVSASLQRFYGGLQGKIESAMKENKSAYMMVGKGTTLFGKTVDNIFTDNEMKQIRMAFKDLRNFGWIKGRLVDPFPITRIVPDGEIIPLGWIEVREVGI